ncbi:FAD binding domain protein [Xylariaceae sp. FL1019]|nr:FAD binding domain protein [Xylariaceae sp. FL1019]
MAKSVVIVGGSLAGLMHGIQHKRLGNNVTVLKQDTGERAGQGSGIIIGDAVNEFYVYRKKTPMGLASWGLIYRLLRANFYGLASAAYAKPPPPLPGDGAVSYLSGKKVTRLETAASSVMVHFVDVTTNEACSLSANLVLGADGIHSTVCRLVESPTVERYAGYVLWRGTVREQELSKETRDYFFDYLKVRFNITKKSYLVGYAPIEAFTDVNGDYHRQTVPRGLVRPEVWERARIHIQVSKPFAELLAKDGNPFVTKINDAFSSHACFHGGKVILVGDAFASFRPHAASALEQCALHSRSIERVHLGQGVLATRVIGDLGRGAVLSFISSVVLYWTFILVHKLRRG